MNLAAPVPPLPPHSLLVFLVAVVVLLLVARLLGTVAERFGAPAIVGELFTGVLLGPSLLGSVAPGIAGWLLPTDPHQFHLLDAVGQIGLLLLVGITGAHLDLGLLRRRTGAAVTVSVTGLVIPLALGVLLGLALPTAVTGQEGPDRPVFALFLGVAMCVTAIPVIAKTLSDMRLLHRNIGQLTLAAGMVDDAVGWLLLSVVAAAATTGVSLGQVSLSVLYLVGFVLFAATVGRFVVRRVMDRVARSGQSGPTVTAAVVIVLSGAVGTHALGMEPVFGAFVAGLLLAPCRSSHALLGPLRTVVMAVLAPLFLAMAGLRMDLTALVDPQVAVTALGVLTVAILGKFVGAYLGARLTRLSPWEGLALGAGMNARGVIEVIVAMTGLRLGVLNTATYTTVILVAIVTSLMAPPLLRLAMAKVGQTEDEELRRIEHDVWQARSVPSPDRGADPPPGEGGPDRT
ncbi:cation:proton antiporter [Micromonospora sp. SH-82]|uniref:cation:proton antiporter n=1 Tax=Micromonospora sp. SH-82 TaxID=3132938 RepID=UPI003EBB24D0